MKIYTNGLGHMAKMVAMPIYGKNSLKNLFLQNQWAGYNETYYVALGMQAHHNVYKL